MNDRSARRVALWLACAAGFVACLGALTTVFLWRNPDVWEPGRDAAPIFRVQSRSMEPTLHGPRFLWVCSNCGASFETSVDVDSSPRPRDLVETDGASGATILDSGENSGSRDVSAVLAKTRALTCPHCGYDRVPAVDPTFEDGTLVRARDDAGRFRPLSFRERIVRAWRRETTPGFREREKQESVVTPERWDVVVFRDAWGRLTLKRIVGLPGELVTIEQGDVLIDGLTIRRDLDATLKTATPIRSVEFRRSDDRIDVVNVARVWSKDGSESMPTAISNESPIPCCNGANVAPPELARDFILRFNWLAEEGVKTRFAVAARRSERAFLLVYDEASRSVVVRSKVLFDGATASGRPFGSLSESDFVNEPGVRAEIDEPVAPDARFTVATVDGELIFAADDRELARFSTEDLRSTQVAAISEPFALLGSVAYARNLALYRDLHYSNAPKTPTAQPGETRSETLVGRAVKTPEGRYFLLGDNSPASIDCRFDSVGTIDASDVLFIVAQ
ncbi:MAG: hypothetical protein J6X44_00010 [Thermoguttaceae bacterium]|nr:hypothetical protein [Thermoguttaceae bacterium]